MALIRVLMRLFKCKLTVTAPDLHTVKALDLHKWCVEHRSTLRWLRLTIEIDLMQTYSVTATNLQNRWVENQSTPRWCSLSIEKHEQRVVEEENNFGLWFVNFNWVNLKILPNIWNQTKKPITYESD